MDGRMPFHGKLDSIIDPILSAKGSSHFLATICIAVGKLLENPDGMDSAGH